MDNLYNRVSRRRHGGQQGFTLIELLVVIAVLAILAGIVIFNVVGVTNRGQASACATDVKSVQTASDAFYNDHSQTYPDSTGTSTSGEALDLSANGKLVPAYMHTAPAPADGTFTYSDTSGTVKASGTGCP
jgi:prepilin-type N-terminal cleavage/methylation domain-containing protein